jgi:putative restriction endonuclease
VLIGFDRNFQVVFSASLKKNTGKDYFVKYFAPIEKATLQMPQKYLPKQEFLEWHLDTIFEKRKEVTI